MQFFYKSAAENSTDILNKVHIRANSMKQTNAWLCMNLSAFL